MQMIRKIFFNFFFMFFMLIGNEYKGYLYLNNYTSSLLPLQSYILYCFNAQKTEKYTNVYICCLAARIIKLLFCLFAKGFSSDSYGDFTIVSEGLHILTCARNSWPLSSDRSLAYCLGLR